MPELPEVTVLAAALDTRLRGARVGSVSMRSVSALKTFDPPIDALRVLAVAGCTRRGKFLDLEAPPLHLVVHLALAGWMRLRDQAGNGRPALRGPLMLVLGFEDGRVLEVTEQGTEKRLAVYVVRDPGDVAGIARLGPDALDPALTPDALAGLLRAQRGTIKTVLADQRVLAGVGNAYSDEILHAARLSPFRRADSLDDAEIASLHASLRGVLDAAVASAAASGPEALREAKRVRMRIHGHTGDPCPACGDVIRQVAMARPFQYCATCQTRGRVYADRRMSRLLR